jgi:hypothetical protein
MIILSREQVRDFLMDELSCLRSYNTFRTDNGKNLVMGLAANYNKEKIFSFVTSLRNSGYADDVVLLTTCLDEETISFLKYWNVIPVKCWQSLFSYLHMQSFRHIAYYDYLSNLPPEGCYKRIFLTDVRDVVFQENPFDVIPEDNITFFLEDRHLSIGSCPWNSQWVRTGFGEEELTKIADKPISCSGTVMGTSSSIMEYLLQMLILSTFLREEALGEISMDQAVHNVLIYRQLISDQRIAENGDGVLTLAHLLGPSPVLISEDKFTAILGREPVFVDNSGIVYYSTRKFAVVHQYDRVVELSEIIRNRWRAEGMLQEREQIPSHSELSK